MFKGVLAPFFLSSLSRKIPHKQNIKLLLCKSEIHANYSPERLINSEMFNDTITLV